MAEEVKEEETVDSPEASEEVKEEEKNEEKPKGMLGKMVLLVAYLIRMRDSGLEASPTYTESRIYKVIDNMT